MKRNVKPKVQKWIPCGTVYIIIYLQRRAGVRFGILRLIFHTKQSSGIYEKRLTDKRLCKPVNSVGR